MARYDDDLRVAECQREIQRLRGVVRGLQDELKRYETIAYNAIVMWQESSYIQYKEDEFKELAMCELGITEEEYNEIMEG